MQVVDFEQLAPGRLVKTVSGAYAFVPNPLPTGIDLPSSTVRRLAQAENALGRLSGTAAREFNPYLVGSPLLHREAILSSRMEGTVTTPQQLVLLQIEASTPEATPRSARDTHEVLNYINAMRHGLNRLNELPVCLRLIREIHQALMQSVRGEEEEPGKFRSTQNWIRGRLNDDIANARFVPPPVPEMTTALADLENYLHADGPDPTLVRLALTHYQFETIHPFRDGNGRVGRLLVPLLLCSRGRLNEPILYVSAYLERHRGEYVDHLLRVSQTGEWLSWIDFFLEAIAESAEESVRAATGLLDLRRDYHVRLQKVRSSALLLKLVDRLFQVPSVTISIAAEHLGISHQAAASNVRKLTDAGVLREITGGRRNQIFVAEGIMQFMSDAGAGPVTGAA